MGRALGSIVFCVHCGCRLKTKMKSIWHQSAREEKDNKQKRWQTTHHANVDPVFENTECKARRYSPEREVDST